MDPMIFQFIGNTVTNATNAFVGPAASNLIIALQLIALTGISLYFTLTAYAIMTGSVQTPFWTLLKQILKLAIIATFALTADGYTNGVLAALEGLETGLADAMNTSGTPPANIYVVLDSSLGKGQEIVGQCFEKASDAGWDLGAAMGWIIAGLVVMLGTGLVSVIGASVIIVAKFSLAIVFALGPFFIFCLMFPITSRFFDAWFAQVLNYILVIVIMAVVMTFAMTAYDTVIAASDFSGSGSDSPMFAALQIGILTGVLSWIALQAGSIASGLAGGLSMAAMGVRHLISPVTGGLRMSKGVGSMINPYSTRRDLESGMMVSGRRFDHLVAGNTAWNPAYRQHIVQQMGKNWGKAKGGSVKR
jgi:type IV secretion system protein VirB6